MEESTGEVIGSLGTTWFQSEAGKEVKKLAKRGPVSVLREKMKRQRALGPELDLKKEFQFDLTREAAQETLRRLEQCREDFEVRILRFLMDIAASGYADKVQGLGYKKWFQIFQIGGFTFDEFKKALITYGNTTGEKDLSGFHLDWNNIRHGNGMFLLGSSKMKVRWLSVLGRVEAILEKDK